MALGVMLVVVVLTIHGVVADSFRANSSLGYNMIVGARGGKLQLTLNTVYYLSQPVETIPYDYYLEFLPAERRKADVENSVAVQSQSADWEAAELAALSGGGLQSLATMVALDTLQKVDAKPLERDRNGQFALYTELAIPLCLGDYYDRFRVVGTTPALFNDLIYDRDKGKKYKIDQGRNFVDWSEEHGFFEAVVGAKVARELNIGLGHKFSPTHGAPAGEDVTVHDETEFTVVGILESSGTPNDRAVFVNIEGFYLIAGHVKPIGDDDADESADGHEHLPPSRLPLEERELAAILILTKPEMLMAAPGIQNQIEEGALESSLDWSDYRPPRQQKSAQAALPIAVIHNLLEYTVKPINWVLLLLTVMICVVSGISILVSIYNSMSERRHEIAVMRALGAGRLTVLTIVLLESIILSVGGGMLGWVGAHGLNWWFSGYVEAQTGVAIGAFDFAPPIDFSELFGFDVGSWWLTAWLDVVSPELFIIPALILLAVIVGFVPAMSAYRTDVAKSLGK